jgi:hypothetical protein
MSTGEDPAEDVINSYPTLRQELARIQKQTPLSYELLKQLIDIRAHNKQSPQLQHLLDGCIMQISLGNSASFDLCFARIKIDILLEALNKNTHYEEIEQYVCFIDELAVTASKSNKAIVKVFERRILLTKDEIDLIDKLEKIFSPVSVMSEDGLVFLNTLRFDPPEGRVSVQLEKEENGTYILTSTSSALAQQLTKDLDMEFIHGFKESKCALSAEKINKLINYATIKYHQKRELLLIAPRYEIIILPYLQSLINQLNNELNLSNQSHIEQKAIYAVNNWKELHRQSEIDILGAQSLQLQHQQLITSLNQLNLDKELLFVLKQAIKDIPINSLIEKLKSYTAMNFTSWDYIHALIDYQIESTKIMVEAQELIPTSTNLRAK